MGEKDHRGGKREGAGPPAANPEDGETSVLTARVPKMLIDKLDAYAKNASLSRSSAVVAVMREALRSH